MHSGVKWTCVESYYTTPLPMSPFLPPSLPPYPSSGCVTSAESVLISQQSQEELYRITEENARLEKVLHVPNFMYMVVENSV